jgi:NB-ARC domain
VIDLIEVLTGERPGFQGIEAATTRLAESLGEGRYLIVVDDVWHAAHARPFLSGGPNCARLLTTRDRTTVPANAQEVNVDAMQREEARRLLAAGVAGADTLALDALAHRLGEWPLLLKLVNGVLRRRTRRREPITAAIGYINEALDEGGLTAFDARSRSDRAKAAESRSAR